MEPTLVEAIRSIKKMRKRSGKSIKELCREHKIPAYKYYRFAKSVGTGRKSKVLPKQQILDVPLHTSKRVFIVAVNIEDLRNVLDSL